MSRPSAPQAPSGALRVSRRAVLVTTVAGSLAGCTGGSVGSPGRQASATAAPTVDPDVALAGDALSAVERVLGVAVATAARHPGLSTLLASAVAAHERHVAVLAGAVPEPESVSPSPSALPGLVPDRPRRAVRAVAEVEHELSRTLAGYAVRARSGPFARVLGSMAASCAQQAATLDDTSPGGTR